MKRICFIGWWKIFFLEYAHLSGSWILIQLSTVIKVAMKSLQKILYKPSRECGKGFVKESKREGMEDFFIQFLINLIFQFRYIQEIFFNKSQKLCGIHVLYHKEHFSNACQGFLVFWGFFFSNIMWLVQIHFVKPSATLLGTYIF